MSFPSEPASFPADDLPKKIQRDTNGKRRKTKDGRAIDLVKDCQLLSLLQYECEVEKKPNMRDSAVLCYPLRRWFRRCQDKSGSFMVETTAWDGDGPSQIGAINKIHGDAHGSTPGVCVVSEERDK